MMSVAVLLVGMLADPTDCEALASSRCRARRSRARSGWRQVPSRRQPRRAKARRRQPAGAPRTTRAHAAGALPRRDRHDALLRFAHRDAEVWLPARTGTASSRRSATAAGRARSVIRPMARALAGRATRRRPPTPGTRAATRSFAIGHPEKLIDFGYRAVHEMTVQAKAIIAALYKRPARLSYWNGCSTGGRQGLMAAQRYPDDFDAILAGAPANNHSRLGVSRLAVSVPPLKIRPRAVPADKAGDDHSRGARRV